MNIDTYTDWYYGSQGFGWGFAQNIWLASATDIVTVTDSAFKMALKRSLDTAGITEYFNKRVDRSVTETLSIVEIVSHIRYVFAFALDTLHVSEVTKKTILKRITDEVAITEFLTKMMTVSRQDAVTITEHTSKLLARTVIETVTIVESIKKYLNGFLIRWRDFIRENVTWEDTARPSAPVWEDQARPSDPVWEDQERPEV